MLWKKRYEPVEEEQVIACNHSKEECRTLLEQWCVQTQEKISQNTCGLVVKPFGRGEFRVHFPFDSAEMRYYYYRHYFLRVWLTERTDGGCDIHYQRVFDMLKGRLCRPLGAILIVTAIIWLIIMRNTTQAWVYALSLIMVWAGIMLMLPNAEHREQGALVGQVLEQAIEKAEWSN